MAAEPAKPRIGAGRHRAAIVGMGKVGRIRAQALAGRDDAALVAVADSDPAAAADLPQLRFDTDYRRIVAAPDVDIVFVATTNRAAPDVVCAALENGKHVFCEKPPGRSLQDIVRIVAAEAAHPQLKLQFGFNHRFHGSVMVAKRLVDSGVYGKILWARGVYGKMGGAGFETLWRSDPEEAGGGILLDQGIHMLDLFRHFIGDFDQIQSFVETTNWDIALEDNAFALLRTPRRQVAMLHSSATQWRNRFRLELGLEDGFIDLEGILSSTCSYGDETLTHARKDMSAGTRQRPAPRQETIRFDTDRSWELETAAFLQAVGSGGPVWSGSSADALSAMQLVFGIYGAGR